MRSWLGSPGSFLRRLLTRFGVWQTRQHERQFGDGSASSSLSKPIATRGLRGATAALGVVELPLAAAAGLGYALFRRARR